MSHEVINIHYFRPAESSGCTPLDEQLFDLAARERPRIRLVVNHSQTSDEAFGAPIETHTPTVLLVRGRRLIARLSGDVNGEAVTRCLAGALAA